MRISDWSSDVCSSDLKLSRLWCVHAHSGGGRCRDQWPSGHRREEPATLQETPRCIGRKLWPCRLGYSAVAGVDVLLGTPAARRRASREHGIFKAAFDSFGSKIGRATCRERACEYV